LIKIAFVAIPNKKHAKAVHLYYIEGWAIYSADPRKPSLCRLFKKPEWVMKYWLQEALAAMKKAILAAGIDGNAARKLAAVTAGGSEVKKLGVGGPFDSKKAANAVYRQDSNGGPDAKEIGAKK